MHATLDAFIDRLEQISLVREQLARGQAAQRLMLAVFMAKDGTVAGEERPTLAGTFALQPGRAQDDGGLTLHGALDTDRHTVIDIRITDIGNDDLARLVDPKTGAQVQDLGVQPKVMLAVSRDPHALASQPARLRAASLWALFGENVRAPYKPAAFEAAVLGARLVRQTMPSLFHPGEGTWVLLKTVHPDELYFAFDAATGNAEFFPKTPNEPNDAARALFNAL
jgi:hypothetical protein